MRRVFFGDEASTAWNVERLQLELRGHYEHHAFDVRDRNALENLMRRFGSEIKVVVHSAAQPSHDWAARDPATDFDINAVGTLNVLEATRRHAPDAVVIFTSTNKVYGDRPNRLPLFEFETRYEIDSSHPYANGISEDLPIDARELDWTYIDHNRLGDHIWWIGSNARFESHYPEWRLEYDVERILKEIHEANFERWCV